MIFEVPITPGLKSFHSLAPLSWVFYERKTLEFQTHFTNIYFVSFYCFSLIWKRLNLSFFNKIFLIEIVFEHIKYKLAVFYIIND